MASIPCAAYQASHIHAQLRKQSFRSRHNSGASVSSQDGSESGSPLVLETGKSVFLPNMKTKMVSVSEWLGEGWKKINANVHLQGTELKAAGVTGSTSDASMTGSITSAASSTNASALVKS